MFPQRTLFTLYCGICQCVIALCLVGFPHLDSEQLEILELYPFQKVICKYWASERKLSSFTTNYEAKSVLVLGSCAYILWILQLWLMWAGTWEEMGTLLQEKKTSL